MYRKIKDKFKKLFFIFYKLGIRMGVYIIPVHYYSPEPNIFELEKSKEVWAKSSALMGIHIDLSEQVHNLKRICIPFQEEYAGNEAYKIAVRKQYGPGFGYIEAQALYGVIRHYKPSRIIEVGSGVSTFCSHIATERNKENGVGECIITCVEPYPSKKLRELADAVQNVRIIVQLVQRVPLDTFTELTDNDILFVDSSHVVKIGSDVSHIMLEVLPRLRKGVLIHFHDIYFPYDYQRDLLLTFLHSNEALFLRAFLTLNDRFKILFCLSHLHYERREYLKEVFPEYEPQSDWKGLRDENYDAAKHFPSSIWLQVCGE